LEWVHKEKWIYHEARDRWSKWAEKYYTTSQLIDLYDEHLNQQK
jgi:hypothetical protein